MRCRGGNLYGQLGDGTLANRNSPTRVPGLVNVVQLAAGYEFTCARLADGTARCWGNLLYGQVGNGLIGVRMTPVAITW